MSSSVKSKKEIGEKRKGCGRIGIFQSLLYSRMKEAF